jgi:Ca2+-binding EF-hand superfamily protein
MNGNQNKLSEEKVQECRNIFLQLDKDCDGTMSIAELGEALKLMNQNPNEEELNQILKEFDKDCSGFLEFSEFLQIVAYNINESNTEEELLEGLKIIDRDQDGIISCEDLKLFLTCVGERLSEDEADNLLRDLDPRGEGFIRYSDLIRNKASVK